MRFPGALGYGLKTATGEELIRTMRSVAAGSAVWDRPIAERLRDAILHAQPAEPAASRSWLGGSVRCWS